MRQPVMVALDGSDKDGRGVAVATAIARLSEGDLHFVRVVGAPPDDFASLPAAKGLYESVEADYNEAQARVAEVAGGVSVAAGRVVTTAVLRSRDVAASLIEHAVERDVLVVVLATRAAGAGARAFAGSVADHVMRESPRPIVLVPPGAAFTAGKELTFKRVLVPLDDSSLSFRSLEFLVELPRAKDMEYALLTVIRAEIGRASAEARLNTTAAWLRSRGAASVDVIVVHAKDSAEAILGAVRETLCDVIVMSTRGAGGLGRLILGSVAEGVVRRSEFPVMLLTPRVLAQPEPATS